VVIEKIPFLRRFARKRELALAHVIDKHYVQSWKRQKQFRKYLSKFACPSCGEKTLTLAAYENDEETRKYEVFINCKCGFKMLLTDHGVRAQYVAK